MSLFGGYGVKRLIGVMCFGQTYQIDGSDQFGNRIYDIKDDGDRYIVKSQKQIEIHLPKSQCAEIYMSVD